MTKPITGRGALIAGGGIAGAVAALALQKAGLRPTMFESFGRGADGVGAFLTLAPNGLDALRAVDVGAREIPGLFDTPRFVMSLGDGRRLIELDSGGKTVRRSDLYRGLRDECLRRGIAVEFGKRLVDARRTDAGSVRARFADGSEAEGDLLVGADGLHSRVRALIDAGAPRPRYLGLLNAGGYARGVEVPGPPGTWHMIFGKRCFFGHVRHPSGEVWWFANPARRVEPTPAELAAISPEAWRRELVDLFARDASPAVSLIRATEHIFAGWCTYDFPHVPVWHRERMIVIGDAAHAMSPSSGQGASMAIEDAVVLGICLRDAPTIEAAFATYEALRRERVERVVAQGKKNGDGKTSGPVGRVLRDLVLRVVFARLARTGGDPMTWLRGHHIDWDQPAAA